LIAKKESDPENYRRMMGELRDDGSLRRKGVYDKFKTAIDKAYKSGDYERVDELRARLANELEQ